MCAQVCTRARARRVYKLPTRTERADGEDVDAHRLNRVRVRDFAALRAVLPFAVGSRRVVGMNGFSVAENAYGAPRHASRTRRAEDQRHPVIQTAPQTVNKRSGELYEFGAVGVYCSIEIKALGRDYVPFSSFSNSVGRRKAV